MKIPSLILGALLISVILVSAINYNYNYIEIQGQDSGLYLEISKKDMNKINQINNAISQTIKQGRVNDYLFRRCDAENFDGDWICDEEVIELKRVIGETELFERNGKTYVLFEYFIKTTKSPNGVDSIYLVINFNDYEEYYVLYDVSNLVNIQRTS